MPNYKLHYFNGRGRGEISRFIFAVADQPYEDVRFEYSNWAEERSKYHFGMLPVLEVDGEKIGQSPAIALYLAKQFGLAGKSDLETFKCHSLAETVRDVYDPFVNCLMESDEKRKETMLEKFNVSLKNMVEKLESYAAKHAGPSGFLVGDSLTYADICIYESLFAIGDYLKRDVLEGHEHLKKHRDAVVHVPRIAKWIEKRPVTPW